MLFRVFAISAAVVAYMLQSHRHLSAAAAGYVKPGTWALVLGGSHGLGEAWAHQLAALKLNLILVARQPTKLEKLKETLLSKVDIQIETSSQDLGNLNETWLVDIFDKYPVRLLVVNAATTGPRGAFLDGDLSSSFSVIDVNVRAMLTSTHVFGKHLSQQGLGGGMVLMSSIAGEVGSAFVANYAASKAYITTFARALHTELSEGGVDVMACLAGPTVTPSYLSGATESARISYIEQEPYEVVSECLANLGRTSWVVTGPLNKLLHLAFTRLLPRSVSVQVFSEQTQKLLGV
ncbi:unnamed protein product [Symbiodinium pilosum]|uniref:Uncharacterized protein n=1 Tax=Symbiodinium pilosum TaxID=2952 RepID=A0A812VYI6_SYMPI|nr:unnamed protein product [Symbiodinium pilosum]